MEKLVSSLELSFHDRSTLLPDTAATSAVGADGTCCVGGVALLVG
jgi:hypothetical protein